MNVSSTPYQNARLLIDGEWVESQTTEWHDIVNPATQQVLAKVPFATPDEVNAAIAAAQRAFHTWKLTPIGARMRIMLKLQALIREHSKRIATVLSAEQGKTIADAEGDIFRGLEVVEHACSIGTLQMGEFAENVAGGVDTYTLRQPIGVCAGITPFNFPAMIPLWMFPMAIACGNTFVLKPSEQDPLSTLMLVELALEAGVPPGVLNVVHGGKEVVDALCTHSDIKAVSFVGSTAVGTHVYDLAGKHGLRVDGTAIHGGHAFGDTGQHAVFTQPHAAHMGRCWQHGDNQLNALCSFTRRRTDMPALLGQFSQDVFVEVKQVQRMPGLEQIARHGRTHVAQANKCNVHGRLLNAG